MGRKKAKPVFQKAAAFTGTVDEYNKTVWEAATEMKKHGLDADGFRAYAALGVQGRDVDAALKFLRS